VDIAIDDDGPGLDPALRETVLRRGVRADESGPGSGFGLSIVRDLVELYGGAVTLERSPLGGLRVTLRLPS
jgi:signal transduction histidine kinase